MLTARMTLGIALTMSLAGGTVALAAVTQAAVRGELADTGEGEIEGRFKIKITERGDRSRQRLIVKARGPRHHRGRGGGALPVYDVWLVDEAGEVEADFGDMRLRDNGHARLRWSTRRADLPEGVESLRDFGGGTCEIRDADGNVVADGDIPGFLGVGDENTEDSGAVARAAGKSRLEAVAEDSRARGMVGAVYSNLPQDVHQHIVVRVVGLPSDAGPYTVVLLTSELGPELLLGEIETRGRFGWGGLHISTRRGRRDPRRQRARPRRSRDGDPRRRRERRPYWDVPRADLTDPPAGAARRRPPRPSLTPARCPPRGRIAFGTRAPVHAVGAGRRPRPGVRRWRHAWSEQANPGPGRRPAPTPGCRESDRQDGCPRLEEPRLGPPARAPSRAGRSGTRPRTLRRLGRACPLPLPGRDRGSPGSASRPERGSRRSWRAGSTWRSARSCRGSSSPSG